MNPRTEQPIRPAFTASERVYVNDIEDQNAGKVGRVVEVVDGRLVAIDFGGGLPWDYPVGLVRRW